MVKLITPDENLRPTGFHNFIGQDKIKESLRISISSAKKRNESVGHVLLSGPPGIGKTSLAQIIANELETELIICSGPALTKAQDLVDIIYTIKQGCIFFIDELHRLPRVSEERLYPVLEDFFLDMGGVKFRVPQFTCIAATTRPAMIAGPLRDRFIYNYRLDFYDIDSIQKIIQRSAKILGVEAITDKALLAVSRASRGTPRIANRLIRWVREYGDSKELSRIDQALAKEALEFVGVDKYGLDEQDRKFLAVLANHGDKAIGIKTIAAQMSEDENTIAETYEPYLLRMNLISRTERGRILTDKGKRFVAV